MLLLSLSCCFDVCFLFCCCLFVLFCFAVLLLSLSWCVSVYLVFVYFILFYFILFCCCLSPFYHSIEQQLHAGLNEVLLFAVFDLSSFSSSGRRDSFDFCCLLLKLFIYLFIYLFI